MDTEGDIISLCCDLTRPKPKVRVRVDWKNMKWLVKALLNPKDYAAQLCVGIGIREVGEY